MNGNGYNDRRSSIRLDMEKSLISLYYTDPNGNSHSRDVICLDVSNGGLMVEMDTPLTVSTEVEVIFRGHPQPEKTPATVLRCEQQIHGWFKIGLQFNQEGKS